jgi:hypothetical protein
LSREEFMARVLREAGELFPEDSMLLINVAFDEITAVTDLDQEDEAGS